MSAIVGLLVAALSSIVASCHINLSDCQQPEKLGRLVCRDSDRLVIATNDGSNRQKAVEFTEFPIKLPPVWIPFGETNQPVMEVNGLISNTTYLIRIRTQGENTWNESGPYKTQTDEEQPYPVSDVEVVNFSYESGKLAAVLIWEPAEDMTCLTELLLHGNDHIGALSPLEIEVENLYLYKLSGLDFSADYLVTLYTRTKEDEESDHVSITFKTPSCMEVTDHNTTLCSPSNPENVLLLPTEDCNIKASWKKPLQPPHKYIIKIYKSSGLQPYQFIGEKTIPGDESKFVIQIPPDSDLIFIKIAASSPAGNSDWVQKVYNNTCYPNIIKAVGGINYTEVLFLIFGACVLLVTVTFLIIMAIMILSKRRAKKAIEVDLKNSKTYMSPKKVDKEKQEQIEKEPQHKINEENSMIPDARWADLKDFELAPENVVLCQQLGRGEFGVVYRALLTDRNPHLDVAVKSLKEGSTADDFLKLESEATVMAAVGRHKHIVSLIGFYRTGAYTSLVVEYCSRGDLLNYLRAVPRPHPWTNWEAKSNGCQILAVSNALYLTEGENNPQTLNFCMKFTMNDMLSFARQIALGMEYLSLNRVVHRDLAARNVLICEDRTAKICDFGLSRDVYETSIYKRRGCDRLPLKWMALESLAYQVFTSKSDVWSYGVVLWEMATLGECPYPSIQTSQLLSLLKQGYRMEKPSHCSSQLYDIMLSCWEGDPSQRPCFATLVQKIDQVISSESSNLYLQLNSDEELEPVTNLSQD